MARRREKSRLTRERLAAFKQGAAWFVKALGEVEAWRAAGEPALKRGSAKRIGSSPRAVAAHALGVCAADVALATLSVDETDALAVFEAAVARGDAQDVSSSKGILDLDTGKVRARYRGRAQIEVDGKFVVFKDRLGVVTKDRKVCLMRAQRESAYAHDEPSLAVLAREADLAEALSRTSALVAKHSVYRHRMVFVRAGMFSVASRVERAEWSSVVAAQAVRHDFETIVRMAKKPEKFAAAGVRLRRGIVLAGPPGVGKTLHVRCLISSFLDAGPVFLVTSTAADDERSSIRRVYQAAARLAPALVVFEDADVVAKSREEPGGKATNIGDLLSALDGEESAPGVYTVMTTNYPDLLDRAVVARPGRIDAVHVIPYPSTAEKKQMLALYLARTPGAPSVEEALAVRAVRDAVDLHGVTGDHVRGLVSDAAKLRVTQETMAWPQALEQAARDVRALVHVDKAFRSDNGAGGGVGFAAVADDRRAGALAQEMEP